MDPMLFTLPEVILSDRGDFIPTPSKVSSHQEFPAEGFASKDEPNIPKPSELTSKTGIENISRAGPLSPSEPLPTLDEPTFTAEEMLCIMYDSIPRSDILFITESISNLLPGLHLIPSFPMPNTLLLGHCGLALVHHQTPALPEPLLTPSAPHYTSWLNTAPIISTPNPGFGFSPHVLVPGGLCFPPPLGVFPDGCTSSCSCPNMMSIHPPCTPDLFSRGTEEHVSEEFSATPETAVPWREEQDKEKAESEGEEEHHKPDQEDQQTSLDEQTKSDLSHGSQLSLDDKTLAECNFEEFMTAMASTCTKVQERENEDNETEKSERENRLIEEFLEKLWNEEELSKECGLPFDLTILDSFLSSDPDFALLDAPEKQEQETPLYSASENADTEARTKGKNLPLEDSLDQLLNSPSVDSSVVSSETEETSQATSNDEATDQKAQSPSLDHLSTILDSNLDDNVQTLPSEESLPASTSKYYNVMIRPLSDGSLFEDDFTLYLDRSPIFTPDPSLTSEVVARNLEESFDSTSSRDVLQEGSTSLSVDDAESSQLPEGSSSEDSLSLESSFHSSDAQSSGNPCTDANLSDPMPERKTPQQPKDPEESQTDSKTSQDIRTTDATEEREENKENESKSRRNVRRSQRLLGQFNKEEASLGKAVENSTEEIEKLPPKIDEGLRRRSSKGRPFEQRDLGDSEEKSQATQVAKTNKHLKEMEEKAQQQNRSGDIQKPEVEEGGLCKNKNPEVNTEIGSEKAFSTNMAQEEKHLIERATGESIPESVRRTTSPMRKERLQPCPLLEGAERCLKQSEIKSSTKRGVQDDCKQEVPEPQTLTILSPMKRSKASRDEDETSESDVDSDSTGCETKEIVSLVQPQSSFKCPRTPEEPLKGPLDKESAVNPSLSPIRGPNIKSVTSSGGEVTGIETLKFYSLRSGTCNPRLSQSIQENEAVEVADHQPNSEPSPDQKTEMQVGKLINGGDALCPSLTSSPTKRCRHQCGASKERETGAVKITSSPSKRGWSKNKTEVNFDSNGQQVLTVNDTENRVPAEKDEVETMGCKPSPTSTSSNKTTKDENIATLSQRQNLGAGKCCVGTRSSCKKCILHFPCTRPVRLSAKLPTKYKDFLLFHKEGHKRQLPKKKGKKGRGIMLRRGKKNN